MARPKRLAAASKADAKIEVETVTEETAFAALADLRSFRELDPLTSKLDPETYRRAKKRTNRALKMMSRFIAQHSARVGDQGAAVRGAAAILKLNKKEGG
jgi:hypothetical protein